MMDQTIINRISRYCELFGLLVPKINIDQKLIHHDAMGEYDKSKMQINIYYMYGYEREVVKHEFIHYMHDRLDTMAAHIRSSSMILSRDSSSMISEEENLTRKEVAMSFKKLLIKYKKT